MIDKVHRAYPFQRALLVVGFSLAAVPLTMAQTIDTPQTRLRPIGSPSLVDQYRPPNGSTGLQHAVPQPADLRSLVYETATRVDSAVATPNGSRVERTAWMQNFDLPTLPPDATINSGPPAFAPNSSPTVQTSPVPASPSFTAPPSLPSDPNSVRSLPPAQNLSPGGPALAPAPANLIPNQDYAPLSQPRLDQPFATLDNSCHVSAPSRYTAASASGCCAPVAYQAPPAFIAPPAPVSPPPVLSPGTVPGPIISTPGAVPTVPLSGLPAGAPAGSLISFGQEQYPVQVGQGLFGQPVAYVPGQKFRNWLRYLFP